MGSRESLAWASGPFDSKRQSSTCVHAHVCFDNTQVCCQVKTYRERNLKNQTLFMTRLQVKPSLPGFKLNHHCHPVAGSELGPGRAALERVRHQPDAFLMPGDHVLRMQTPNSSQIIQKFQGCPCPAYLFQRTQRTPPPLPPFPASPPPPPPPPHQAPHCLSPTAKISLTPFFAT